MPTSFIVRPLTPADGGFLWEMAYHLAPLQDGAPPPHDVVYDPEIAAYIRGWGRPGDAGFVAISTLDAARIGAAWIRIFDRDRPGRASADGAPELAIAVRPENRGEGIGSMLLERIVEASAGRHTSLVVALEATSPALSFCLRNGFHLSDRTGNVLTLTRMLTVETPRTLFPKV